MYTIIIIICIILNYFFKIFLHLVLQKYHRNYDIKIGAKRGKWMMLSIKQKVLAATAALVLTTGALMPTNGQAYGVLGNVLGSVINGAAAMSQINAQIKELETNGRYDYFQQMKEKYGVNYEERANAQLDRVMSNLTRVIAKYDNSVYAYPYNYFVNNDQSFNAFCTIGHNVSVNIGLFIRYLLNFSVTLTTSERPGLMVAKLLFHGLSSRWLKMFSIPNDGSRVNSSSMKV